MNDIVNKILKFAEDNPSTPVKIGVIVEGKEGATKEHPDIRSLDSIERQKFLGEGIELREIKEEAVRIIPVDAPNIAQELIPLGSVITSCVYPRCGGENVKEVEVDDFETRTYKCNDCLNVFKIAREGDVYLFEKVKKVWSRLELSK